MRLKSYSFNAQILFFVLAMAVLFGMEPVVADQSSDPLSCFAVPSHWTGQLNPSNGGSYRVELELRRRAEESTARYLGPDSKWHGPYGLTVDRENEEISFEDGPANSSKWILRCGEGGSLEGGLEQASQGQLATPTARVSFTPTTPAPPLSSCFAVPSHWVGQMNPSNGGSYRIELEFKSRSNKPSVRYLGPDSKWHGVYGLTVDEENREISFKDGAGKWILRCGQGGSLGGGLEEMEQGLLATPTANASFTRKRP